jgi:hypothetical protein
MRPVSSSQRLLKTTWLSGACRPRGTSTIADPVRWLSQVCEVITDPSVDARRPTMIDVHGQASPPGKKSNRATEVHAGTDDFLMSDLLK